MYEQGGKCLTLPFAPLPRQGKCGGALSTLSHRSMQLFGLPRWNDVIILPRRAQRNTPLHFAKKCCTVPAPVLYLLYFYIFHAFSIIIFTIIF